MKTAGQILSQTRYASDLNSPEWEAFSKSIRTTRGNTCECCHLGNRVTQVHHLFYDAGKPWEADPSDVVLLCSICHKEIHEELKQFRKTVFRKLTGQSFKILNQALAKAFEVYNPLVFAHALVEFARNERLVENHAKAWGVSVTVRCQRKTGFQEGKSDDEIQQGT